MRPVRANNRPINAKEAKKLAENYAVNPPDIPESIALEIYERAINGYFNLRLLYTVSPLHQVSLKHFGYRVTFPFESTTLIAWD